VHISAERVIVEIDQAVEYLLQWGQENGVAPQTTSNSSAELDAAVAAVEAEKQPQQ